MQLSCQNLSFEIKGKKILYPTDIKFKKAKITTIIGPNGAGKSTLVHLLSGGEKPTSGLVTLNDKELSTFTHSDLSKFRAVLSQQNNISFPIKVNDVVEFGRHPHCGNYLSKTDHEIVQSALQFFELLEFKDRQYQSLSGGEKQRVHFARIWAQLFDQDLSGKILFLDEPLTYLDINFQIEFLKTLKNWSLQGLTIIGVLHHINLALLFSDEILLIDEGKIIAQESPDEIIKNNRIDSLFKTKSIVFESNKYQHLCFEP